MAPGRRRSRSRSRGPCPPPARPGWNVWRPGSSREDWPEDRTSYRRPDDVYTDRRNDGSYRSDYDGRSRPSGSYRSSDDYNVSSNQQAIRDTISPEKTRRRASMVEPNAAPAIRPQIVRHISSEDPGRNTYTESPVRSPISATSSVVSNVRASNAKTSAILKAANDSDEPSEVVTDPRLRMLRSVSVPDPLMMAAANTESITTPITPTMNLDGGSDTPETARPSHSSVSPDEPMIDAALTENGIGSGLIEALLQFIAPAVASGIQERQLAALNHDYNKTKEEKDKAAKQPRLPTVVLEGHKLNHALAAKSYKAMAKGLQDAQVTRSSSASELVKQIGALVSRTSTQHHRETQLALAKGFEVWRNQMTQRVEACQTELADLRVSSFDTERVEAMMEKQSELESLMKKAQPRFEKNIDFLMDKHNVQQGDFAKLREEISFLKDKQKDQEIDVSKLRGENASLKNRQDQQGSDFSKLWVENKSLKSEMRILRKEMRDQQETLMLRLKQHVLRSDFDEYKAISNSDRRHKEEMALQPNNIDAEMKVLGAQIVDVKETIDHKLTQHVLKTDFNSFKAESRVPSTTTVTRRQDDNATTSYEKPTIDDGLKKISEELNLVSKKASGFALAKRLAMEAMKRSEQLQQQLDQFQNDLAESSIQMSTGGNSRTPSLQKASSADAEGEIRKLWAAMLSLETREKSMQAQIRQIQITATLSASSSTKKALGSGVSHAMGNRIDALAGQVGNVKSELKRLRERQTQSPPSNTLTTSPPGVDDRVHDLEKWNEAHKAVISTILSNVADGKTAVEKQIAGVEISVRNVEQNLRVLHTRVDEYQSSVATKQDLASMSSGLDQHVNRPLNVSTLEVPSMLSTKERMLLNTLDTTPKRLNNLENTVLALARNEEQISAQSQHRPSANVLKEYDDRLTAMNVTLNRVTDEVMQKVDGWEDGLRQVSGHTQGRICNLEQSLEKERMDLRASEHSVKSLTSRYNNLTSEGVARRVAEIVQPLPTQLQREQASLKTALAVIESEVDKINKLLENLKEAVANSPGADATIEKARELFADLKDIHNLQETLLSTTTRVSHLENATRTPEPDHELGQKVTDLLTQFEKGRDALQTNQEELKKRVRKLEGRAAHASEWDDEETDEERTARGNSKAREESSQRDSNILLSSFKPHYAPTTASTARPTSSSASSKPVRASPAVKKASQQSSQDSVSFACRISQEPLEPRGSPLRSLTSCTEPPKRLANRIEAPKVANQPSAPQKRRHTISDEEEGGKDDTVVVQPSGKGNQGRQKRKKFSRLH